MNQKEIIRIMRENGLQKATTRELSLLTMSVIGNAYHILLRKKIGFSYDLLGALGNEKEFISFVNEGHISDKIHKFLENDFGELENVLLKTSVALNESLAQIDLIKNSEPSEKILAVLLTKFYPEYMSCLALHNCFLRYVGDEEKKGSLSVEMVRRLAFERQKVSEHYIKIEELIDKMIFSIEKKTGKNIPLIKNMLLSEAKEFLTKSVDEKKMIDEYEKRKKGYFYFFMGKEEIVFTDECLINAIRHEFLLQKSFEKGELKGRGVFPGKAVGVVYNIAQVGSKPSESFVLVAHATKPDDTILIGRSLAVITDEGGMLSHAAIVCRELKKPCVVGTKHATHMLKTGDMIEVDANKGTVRKIN